MRTTGDVRGLAFLRRAEGASRLPPGFRIVPLWPSPAFPNDRLLAPRPEDLLSPEDEAAIESAVNRGVESWSQMLGPAVEWRGVSLAECLRFDLRYALRDLLKTSAVVEKAVQMAPPTTLLTDAGVAGDEFPPYPYFHAVLPLLRAHAERRGIVLKAPESSPIPSGRSPRLSAASAYARVLARRSMRLVATGKTPVAVGPYPEFYAPLARVCRAQGRPFVVATPVRSLIRPRGRDGYAVLPFEPTLAPAERRELAQFSQALQARIATAPLLDLPRAEADVLEGVFRAHLLERLRSVVPELGAAGVAFERGLRDAAHLLLLETASPLAKAAVRYSRKWGVPVTVLQHGILGDVTSYGETEGDRVAAWGPRDAEWFRGHLGSRVRAVATGCPRYDLLAGRAEATSPSVLRDIPRDRKVIMYAAQPFVPGHALASPWTNAEALTMALAAAATSETNVLLVKWHPSQKPEPLPESTAASRPRVVEAHRGDTFACLRRADVLLVVSSTVALEGMFLGRPVVFLGHQDALNEFDPPRWNAGLRALDAGQAEQHVRRLQDEPRFRAEILEGQKAFLARTYSPLDGRAAERAVDLLMRR